VNLSKKKQPIDEEVPAWLGEAAVWSLIGTVAIIGIVVVVIASGATDPKPTGSLMVDQTYAEGLSVKAVGEESLITSEALAVFTPPGTIEITARQVGGPTDAAFGVWWGEAPDGSFAITGANSNGYIGSYRVEDGLQPIEDWHRWPWVKLQGESNRIWLDFADGQVQVRINEEVAVTFAWDDFDEQQVGLFVLTMSTGESVVEVERVRVWQMADGK
jgi:hypothetical protein